MSICFVPQALTASIEDCTLSEMFEFTTRQMKLTRVYAPNLWKLSFFGAGLFNAVMISAVAIAVFSHGNFAPIAAIFTILVVAFFSIGKSWLRLSAVRLALTDHSEAIRKQTIPQLVFWTFTPAIFFVNCSAALFSRHIKWRGISYKLVSPTETIVLRKR
jgi:hypothetical protein